MQVDWSTIEALAATRAIDLWILFPLGQAVNRLLTRNGIPEGGQAQRLTRFFGIEDLKEAFYQEASDQPSMFDMLGEETGFAKRTSFDAIGHFFVNRLEQVFVGSRRIRCLSETRRRGRCSYCASRCQTPKARNQL